MGHSLCGFKDVVGDDRRNPNRPTGHIVVEDAPHHGRFGVEDHLVGQGSGSTSNPPLAVRDLPGNRFPGARSEEHASAVALSDLGSLVLSERRPAPVLAGGLEDLPPRQGPGVQQDQPGHSSRRRYYDQRAEDDEAEAHRP